MRLPGSVLLITFLAAPLPALAQQRDYATLRDSLSRVTRMLDLEERERSLARGLRAKEPPALIERGLVLWRLYEMKRENGLADDARDAFEKALEREPDNAFAHFALGHALANGPGVRVPSPGGILDGFVLGQSVAEVIGQDPRSRAVRRFLKALELDPTLTPAATQLTELVLASRNKDALRRARDIFRKMVDSGSATPDLTVSLARIQSALGDVEGAEAATAALPEAATASAWRARAEALLRQPGRIDAGAAAYFEGIEKLEQKSAAEYFADLRMVASAAELASWESASLEGRKAWLRRFWELRAASSGKTVAERVSEHYRRLAEAQARFRRQGARGGAPHGSLLQQRSNTDASPFDERGLIYVRHGEPAQIIRTASLDLRSNETWVYELPDGRPQMFHFVVLRDGTDFRLVDDVMLAIDPSGRGLPVDGIIKLLEDRAPYDARYTLLASRFTQYQNRLKGLNADIREAEAMLPTIGNTRSTLATETREATLAALETDSDRPRFEAALPFYYDIFSFKGKSGTDLTAAIAIPGPTLEPRAVRNQFIYALQISLIVIDTLAGTVTRRDSTHYYRSERTLGEQEHLRLHVDLGARASRSSIHRLVVRDLNRTGTGQMYGGGTAVPPYDSPGLMISNIVLAEPDTGSWHRGNARLALVPPRQFFAGEPLTLFYELYNLPAGAQYRTEITLAPAGEQSGFTRLRKLLGGSDGSVRLQFDATAQADPNGNVQEVRKVATELKPGKYVVRARVTNLVTQQVAASETQFVVIEKR